MPPDSPPEDVEGDVVDREEPPADPPPQDDPEDPEPSFLRLQPVTPDLIEDAFQRLRLVYERRGDAVVGVWPEFVLNAYVTVRQVLVLSFTAKQAWHRSRLVELAGICHEWNSNRYFLKAYCTDSTVTTTSEEAEETEVPVCPWRLTLEVPTDVGLATAQLQSLLKSSLGNASEFLEFLESH